MWKIEVTKNGNVEHGVWNNKHTDDFCRFIPQQFGVDESAIKFYRLDLVSVATMETLITQVDGNGDAVHVLDVSEPGKVRVKQVSDDAVVMEVAGTEVAWDSMYDANMNFISQ